MFSGIVKIQGLVKKRVKRGQHVFFSITKPRKLTVAIGESINVDGICSTVVKTSSHSFTIEYIPETLRKTTAKNWSPDRQVNIEKSLSLNDLVNGHLVTGHVDITAKIVNVRVESNSKIVTVSFPDSFSRFLVEKGSVAINGVSLTIVAVKKNSFTVALIPFTQRNTNLGELEKNDYVNVEFDLIAKYVQKMVRNSL